MLFDDLQFTYHLTTGQDKALRKALKPCDYSNKHGRRQLSDVNRLRNDPQSDFYKLKIIK